MESRENRGNTRTLFLLNSLGIGGSERKSVRIVNRLHEIGWEVHLGYLNGPADLLSDIHPDIPILFLNRKSKLPFGAVSRLRSYLKSTEITKVVCINLFPLLCASLACAFSKRPNSRMSVMVNATKHPSNKAQLQMYIYRPLLMFAQEIVFGCELQRAEWIARYGLDETRCAVIYNGVDENKFRPNISKDYAVSPFHGFGKSSSDFLIGSVGNLRPEKNHVELVMAMADLKRVVPNAKLIIVGEGDERKNIERIIKKENLENCVSLVGQIDDVRSIVNLMDVFVLPSISDTFSNAALEAMSMGVPVILSDSGGASEMVEHGESGLIYQTGDTSTLTRLLCRLAREAGTRERLGTHARMTVIEKFSFARMVEKYELLLRNELLNTNA